MSTIHFHQSTASTPKQFVAGLTDFGPGRSELFPNSADGDLEVHHTGPSDADVTEGSGGIWERLYYDWSDPNRVTLKTTASNTWEAPQATFTPSARVPTAPPMWTLSLFARARTSRDASYLSYSERSARAY